MIRRASDGDLNAMVDVWFAASVQAHDFVDREFWAGNRTAMRERYLPGCSNWVIVEAGEVAGFYSLEGDRMSAIFVRPESQGRGMGGRLMAHAKARRERLELFVYEENASARAFYRKQGFVVARSGTDAGTGHPELLLEWKADAPGGRD